MSSIWENYLFPWAMASMAMLITEGNTSKKMLKKTSKKTSFETRGTGVTHGDPENQRIETENCGSMWKSKQKASRKLGKRLANLWARAVCVWL